MGLHPARDLRKRLAKAIAQTAEALSRVAGGDMGSVHAARKELKRLRSLLALWRTLGARPAVEAHGPAIAAAARTLAGVRHAQAMTEALAKLASSLGEEAAAGVAAALASAAGPEEAPPPPDPQAIADALAALAALERAAARLPAGRAGDRAVVKAIALAYRSARRRLRKGLSTQEDARLHAARKAAIRLLHQLAVIERAWPRQVELWAEILTDLREQLGDANDLAELEGRLAARPEPPNPTAQGAIERRRKELLADARRTGRLVLADKPRAFRRRLEVWLAAR